MKQLFTTLVLLLVSSSAIAAQLPIPAQEMEFKNYLVNPGFENGKQGWQTSGGATSAANTTAKGEGNYGYDWDSNSAAQTLLSNAVTIPAGLYGKNGLAYCKVKVPSGTSTHTITVNDGSNDLVTAQTLSSYSDKFAIQPVTFTFPSSGTIRLKLVSVASNEPELYIDGCFLGENWKVGAGNFVSNWSSYTPTTQGMGTATFTDVQSRRVGDSGQVRAFIQVGTVTGSEARFYLPTGWVIDSNKHTSSNYSVVGQAVPANTSNAFLVLARGGDNYFTFSWPQVSTNQSLTPQTGTAAFGNSVYLTLHAQVAIVGWSSGELYAPEAYNWKVDASIAGGNPSLGTSAVTSYTGITNSSLTLTNNSGAGNVTAQIPCSSTNAPTGTTCAVGDESLGVSFNAPVANQDVEACVGFSHNLSTGASGVVQSHFQIVETAANAQTVIQSGKERIVSGTSTASLSLFLPHRLCGTFTFASAGQKTLRLMYTQGVSGTVSASSVIADAGSGSDGSRDVHWTVRPLNQTMPAPVLVGSISSNTSGTERIERAEINCDAASAITSQSGSWLSSVGNRSTTSCSLTIAAGIFSATPACVFTVKASTVQATSASMTSATAGTVYAANADYDGYLICMGPR